MEVMGNNLALSGQLSLVALGLFDKPTMAHMF